MSKSIPAKISQRLAACGWIEPIALRAAEERLSETPAALREMDIVWIDALQRLGLLTPTQAEFFYAGRESQLTCGLYLISRKRLSLDGIDWYEATSEGQSGYLLAVGKQPLQERPLSPIAGYRGRIVDTGQNGDSHWAAAILPAGKTLAELLTRYGRMPSTVVIAILRQLVHQLLSLETAGRMHGRVSPETVLLSADGITSAPLPGVCWPSASPLRKSSDMKQLAQLMRQLLCGIPHGAPPRVPFNSLTADPLLCELQTRQNRPEVRLADWFALLGPSDQADARLLQNYLGDPPLVLPSLHVHLREEANRRRKRNMLVASSAAALLAVGAACWPSPSVTSPELPIRSPAPLTAVTAKPLVPEVLAKPSREIHLASIEMPTAALRRVVLPSRLTVSQFPQAISAEATISAAENARTILEIDAAPLRLTTEKLTLERIDFVASGSTAAGRAALLEVAASSITLRDCTFRWQGAAAAESIALAWRPVERTSAGLQSLPEAKLDNCRFDQLLVGVDVSAIGDAAIHLHRCHYEGVGGLVRTQAGPSPLRFHFQGSQLTTTGGMLWHHFQADRDLPFSANVRIADSQISPGDNGAAVAIIGTKGQPYAPAVRFDLRKLTIADDAPLATFFDSEQFQPLPKNAFAH
ncbi:hypothetical protein [Blastopirellula marina]|uniref:Protein kinase domain-containing protein n=1 Tax=Blastopirellula marina DSM 3645 TaxID=314230 RepID=A4A038_9BACT|nr:hypothetical protein [Blastopirellula marina]EAQ77824.1 hypothetical protein DSM3645_05969 [Blastopirellula marina DSM 3645]